MTQDSFFPPALLYVRFVFVNEIKQGEARKPGIPARNVAEAQSGRVC